MERNEGFYGCNPLLLKVEFFAFGKEIKRQVNEEQNYECDMCHHRVEWMGPHHVVPEKALLRRGIKGKDVRGNAVGLCSGEWGRGENSPDDCHQVADMKAIHENKFWHNGRFVELSELDPETYIGNLRCLPERREHRRKKYKERYRRHHRH